MFQHEKPLDDLETTVMPAEPGQLYFRRGLVREPPTASKRAMEDIYRSNLAHALFQVYNGTTDPINIETPRLSGQSCSALARQIIADGKYSEAMAQLSRTGRDNDSKERVHEYLTQYAQAAHSNATTNGGQMVYLDIRNVFFSDYYPFIRPSTALCERTKSSLFT